jgi:hypothetical protein
MLSQDKIFVPTNPFNTGLEEGVSSAFEPGTRSLPIGFQVARYSGPCRSI